VSTGLRFFKMSGSGNDFVMLDGRTTTPVEWTGERVRAICDRRDGVGADGLAILTPESAGTVRMTFWNCDGSPANMCGNAALCSTRLSARLGLAPAEGMTLATGAGPFPTRCVGTGDLAELHLPDFDLPAEVPGMTAVAGELWIRKAVVGVEHLVTRVADLERFDLPTRGREQRFHPAIAPRGANANFVAAPAAPGGPWRVRTYERGVEGETLACGTGTVAAAVALAANGEASLPLTLKTRSGRNLSVRARLEGGRAVDVWLQGEGRLVFEGLLAS
jgi:diaminopimelate epimerase